MSAQIQSMGISQRWRSVLQSAVGKDMVLDGEVKRAGRLFGAVPSMAQAPPAATLIVSVHWKFPMTRLRQSLEERPQEFAASLGPFAPAGA